MHEALYRLYLVKPGVDCDPPEVQTSDLYVPAKELAACGGTTVDGARGDDLVPVGMWRRLPRPKAMQPWLTKADVRQNF